MEKIKTFESTPYSSNVWTNNLEKSDIKSSSTPIKVKSVYSAPKWLKLDAGYCSELSNTKPLSNLSEIQTRLSLNKLVLLKDLEKKCYLACNKSYVDNVENLKIMKQLDINKLEDIRRQDVIVRKIIEKFNIYLQNYNSEINMLDLLKLAGIRNNNDDLDNVINQFCKKCNKKTFLKILENNQVDTYRIFLLRLTPNNVNKWFNTNDLFDEIFIKDVANSILSCVENIVEFILKNNLNLSQYNMWEVYCLSNKHNNTEKIVEHSLFDIGKTTNTTNINKVTNEQELNSAMNQSSVIGGMTKLVSNALNNAVAKNQSDLMRSLAVSNTLAIGNAKGSSFNISNINQENVVQQEINGSFVQSISSKIITDITTNINDQVESIKKAIKDTNITNNTADTKQNSTNATDLASSMMGASIGSSTNTTNDNETTNKLKSAFNLDQSFQYHKQYDASQALNNALSSNNLAQCVAKSQYANTIAVGNIGVSGPINISDIQQKNIVKDIMSCAFSQTVITEIASKIVSNITSMIKQCADGTDKTASNNTVDNKATSGDIYAVGGAVAGILSSAGSAVAEAVGSVGTVAKGLGEGINSAATGVGAGLANTAKGIGSGLSETATGLGSGISSAGKGLGDGIGGAAKDVGASVSGILGNLTAPLIGVAIVGVVGVIGFIFIKPYLDKKP